MRLVCCTLAVCWLSLFGASALAECQRPRPEFEIPDGTSTTQADLATTQRQLLQFAGRVTEYFHCLQGELGQKSLGKDEATKNKLGQSYQDAHKEAADELAGLAQCYDAQLASFKASGGGSQRRPADCSQYLQAAAHRTTGQNVEELVVEASGHRTEVPGGSWIFLLARDDVPRRCGANYGQECLYRALIVRNESESVLECKGEITYEGTDIDGNPTTQSQALVLERSARIIAASLAQRDVNASTFDARCTPRAKLPALNTPAGCKYEVVKPIDIADYYPAEARAAGEEGPVTLEFTLRGKPGNPTDVRVVASSLFPRLDEAAVKAISDMVMSSKCPNTRYRLRVSFQLN